MPLLLLVATAHAYDCDLYPADTCTADGVVVATTVKTAVAAVVDMAGTYQRLDLFAELCNPVGYVLHLSDSPTSTGAFVGDAGTTDHDAELVLRGRSLVFNGSGDGMGMTIAHQAALRPAIDPAWLDARGCAQVHVSFVDGASRRDHTLVRFDPDPDDSSGTVPVLEIETQHGPRLSYTLCGADEDGGRGWACEWEDLALADMELWYVALNRTVGDDSRVGRGVRRACVTLTEDRSITPGSCL